mgnify:CR=1 FL=1
MRISTRSPVFMIGAAVLVLIIAGLAYALWQASRSESVEFQVGDESVEIEAEG